MLSRTFWAAGSHVKSDQVIEHGARLKARLSNPVKLGSFLVDARHFFPDYHRHSPPEEMASAAAEQMDIDEQKIDEGLYSRQLYVLSAYRQQMF